MIPLREFLQHNAKLEIGKRLESYKEPARKGTKKGDPVGLSLFKYKTALYSGAGVKQIKLSEAFKVSYGLVRKWHCEPEFNKVRSSMRAFVINQLQNNMDELYDKLRYLRRTA